MVKFGMFSWFSYPLPIKDRLQKIKRAGFDAVSLWWGDDNKDEQPDIAGKLGLTIDNVHAPFDDPTSLWFDTLNGGEYLQMLLV